MNWSFEEAEGVLYKDRHRGIVVGELSVVAVRESSY